MESERSSAPLIGHIYDVIESSFVIVIRSSPKCHVVVVNINITDVSRRSVVAVWTVGQSVKTRSETLIYAHCYGDVSHAGTLDIGAALENRHHH